MTITDILKIYGLRETDLAKFGIVRHTPREMGDYLLDDRVFQFYQSVQDKGKFDKYTHIISFVATRENRTIFRGIYRVKGRNPLVEGHFRDLPISINLYEHYKALIGKFDYYELEKDPIVNDMIGRLAIDWGGGELAWYQAYNIQKPKKVSEILPEGYFKDFVTVLQIARQIFAICKMQKHRCDRKIDQRMCPRSVLSMNE